MTFTYSPQLVSYLQEKKKKNIIVEVVSIDHSDIDMTELHVYAISDKRADYMIESKKYREVVTEVGRVLLPPYHLEYAQEIRFDLKKTLCFYRIIYEGISL